jgi:hypothetical protein
MSQKRYLVTLAKDEEQLLHDIMNKGKHGAGKRKRAQALLLANEGHGRNKEAGKINWRFTTADARIKLKRLYPQFE